VTEYLNSANLTPYLEALGFHTVGYGCTTCIGNSGPLPETVTHAIQEADLVATSVLSGNRNFSGRINPDVRANYLASPALVVAYALAGTVDIDLQNDPIGRDHNGEAVYLKDVWPTQQEILDVIQHNITPEMYDRQYGNVYTGNQMWNEIPATGEPVYRWNDKSSYIQEPPFFLQMSPEAKTVFPIVGARALGVFGDSVTTDHISPAGDIAEDSPAGSYLKSLGVEKKDFNTYGTRRGNDRIMTRGTFANVRLRNRLVPGSEGNITYFLPTMETMSFYDAGQKYIQHGVPLVILAGKDYGMGSSRDWAAKGTFLLGVKAVIAESFERIHRSNLVMMGVLPLTFEHGQGWSSLGLTGQESFEVPITDDIQPMQKLQITATDAEGNKKVFSVVARLNSPVEVEYYKNGGILQTILRGFMRER
jgi:aconitate hydratase